MKLPTIGIKIKSESHDTSKIVFLNTGKFLAWTNFLRN